MSDWDWWSIGGYIVLFYCVIAFPMSLIEHFGEKKKEDTLHPFGGLVVSILLLGLAVWLFSKSGYQYGGSGEAAEITTAIVVGILAISLVVGIIFAIYKASKNSDGPSFGKRVAISTTAGLISSFIAHAVGIGEGINIFSATIGGLVFLSVSIFGAS